MHLTEAEDIKKRWQEYREELYKKDLHDLDNHDGVIIPKIMTKLPIWYFITHYYTLNSDKNVGIPGS